MTTHPERTTTYDADERGWFGDPGTGFGGRYMPEALVAALDELHGRLARGDGRPDLRRGVRHHPA